MTQRSLSQVSQSRSAVYFDELGDEELVKQVGDLKEQIHILKLENEIIEKTILRLEPGLMHGVQQAIDYAYRLQSSPSFGGSVIGFKSQTSRIGFESLASPSRMLSSPSKISTRRVESAGRISGKSFALGFSKKVNILERSELVATEIEIIMTNLEKTRKNIAKKHSLLKANLEEISERVANIQKSIDLFQQIVIEEGVDKITQKIPAEIWIRFLSEWLKMADAIIGKYRLRTSTLNTQHSKLKSQIKVKAELSESLRPIDFEKLKIQNGECLKTIDKKNVHLVELKKMTGDANLTLTIHKNLMMEQNNYITGVIGRINQRGKETKDIDKERDIIAEEAEKLEGKLELVKTTRMKYEVPDIMQYVEVKAQLHELKNGMKWLKNRCHLQHIALSSIHRKIRSMSNDSAC